MQNKNLGRFWADICQNISLPLTNQSKILDYGCGKGHAVFSLATNGYDAYGFELCDFIASEYASIRNRFTFWGQKSWNDAFAGAYEASTPPAVPIDNWKNFSLPYPDESFSHIITNGVLDHIHDLPSLLSEIVRILRPGGVMVNLCAGKYYPYETHIHVPFGNFFRSKEFYLFFARLGCRSPMTQGIEDPHVVAKIHYDFVQEMTVPILSEYEYKNLFETYFSKYKIQQHAYIKSIINNKYYEYTQCDDNDLKIKFKKQLVRILKIISKHYPYCSPGFRFLINNSGGCCSVAYK